MTATEIIEEIRSRARELSPPEREQLARDLVVVSEELDEEAEYLAAVDEGLAELDAGKGIDGDVVFREVHDMLAKLKR